MVMPRLPRAAIGFDIDMLPCREGERVEGAQMETRRCSAHALSRSGQCQPRYAIERRLRIVPAKLRDLGQRPFTFAREGGFRAGPQIERGPVPRIGSCAKEAAF